MDTAQCYRLLELKATANLEDVKTSYRRLARRWHPDINPDSQQAHDMFIKVTQAYQVLLKVIPPTVKVDMPQSQSPQPPVSRSPQPAASRSPQPAVKVKVTTRSPQPPSPKTPQTSVQSPKATASTQQPETPAAQSASPSLSAADQKIKLESYHQLQDLIKRQRLPRAIALVEALGNRWPQDLEVRQWRALIYQCWAKQLIRERKLNQARAYLKKALKTDPHNKSLWSEVQRDFLAIEKVL